MWMAPDADIYTLTFPVYLDSHTHLAISCDESHYWYECTTY